MCYLPPIRTTCLFVLLLIVCHACEKKEIEVICYECEMTYASGQPAGSQYPCSEDILQWQKEQIDNNGQPIKSDCREK